MTRRRLPIGIQDFRTVREEDCYYVDKTPLVRRLVDGGATISSPAPAGSARACCWTRCGRCSGATRGCSGASASTATGTGPPPIRWSG